MEFNYFEEESVFDQSVHQSIALRVEERVIEDDVVRWNARWRRAGAGPVDVARGRASAPRLRVFAGAVNTPSPSLAMIMLVPLTCRLQAYHPEHHVERRLSCHLRFSHI